MKNLNRRAKQLIAIAKYMLVKLSMPTDKRLAETWLISERGDEAKDNGYALYKRIKEKHPEIEVKYVIAKNSKDLSKIAPEDRINFGSFKHIRAHLSSKYLISTHIQGTSPEFHCFMKLSKYAFFRPKGKEIMLQHGVTKDFMTNMLKKNNPNLALITCATVPEYNYIKKNFGYKNKEVQLTGFARYDNLRNIESNVISLMPTWRTYLFNATEEEFCKSAYYKNYSKLINSKKLDSILKKHNLKLVFYPHYEIKKWLYLFRTNSSRIQIADTENDIQQIINSAKLLITDYTSIAFDFAYLHKPTIYYQFDSEEYRRHQYSNGYFDYKTDGFGPVVENLEDLLKSIEAVINGPSRKSKESIFAFHDSNNSERIIQSIKRVVP